MSEPIECPACGTQLSADPGETTGTRVRCPRCKEVFVAGSTAQRSSGRRRQGPPRPPEVPSRPKQRSSSAIILAAVGVGVLVVFGVAAVTPYYLMGGRDDAASDVTGVGGDAGSSVVPELPVEANALSNAEANAFAEQLEQAVNSGDQATVARYLNYSGLIDRAVNGVDAPERWKEGFKRGLVFSGSGLAQAIITQAGSDDGSYMFVRRSSDGGTQQVLFRLITSEGGLNYHRFDLARVSGEVRAADMFIAASGENLTASFRRLCLVSAPQQSLLSRLAGKEKLFVKHGKLVQQTQKAFSSGDYRGGMRMYDQLPPEIQREKFLLLPRIRAAGQGNFNNADYLKALEAFRTAYPKSVAADLLSIDTHFLRKEYGKSIDAIDRLEQFVGLDPYLDIFRGRIHHLKGDDKRAAELMRPLLKDEDLGKDATVSYLDVVIALPDHAETLETLLRLEREYGLEFPRDLSTIDVFKQFAATPQHAKFKQR